jgi:hypothetical protein
MAKNAPIDEPIERIEIGEELLATFNDPRVVKVPGMKARIVFQ